MIVKAKGGYAVKSHSGKNLGGPYKNKRAARRRLGQIEYFKRMKHGTNRSSY